ncbi:MAG: YtfJ family protein, partial [Haemophilus parainfluenzae]|nr:YtfJ family protein [Haemophilus parainfluenzae]
LREKDSVIILLDKTGKVQFVKEGKLTDDEVKEVISRATALMAK